MKRNILGIFVAILFGFCTFVRASTIEILSTGEIHGMLEPCDCPVEKGGGVAKIAQVFQNYRGKENILLLDGGGFSAGGMYDSYTQGRLIDSIRTLKMLRSMAQMQYDAIGIGDEELQYGASWLKNQQTQLKLPLVSVNCFDKNGGRIFEPVIYKKLGQFTIAITALTTTEEILKRDQSYIVKDPIQELSQIWQEILKKSDLQIVISHLGQEKSEQIYKIFPDADVVINGHRKSDTKVVSLVNTKPLIQFGFEGKKIAHVTLEKSSQEFKIIKNQWIAVNEQIKSLPAINTILQETLPKVYSKKVYDLYIMSQCPYGLEALKEMIQFRKNANIQDELLIWFIGSFGKDSSLQSLHGNEEVEDEKLWLAVQELYPDKWEKFLEIRSNSPSSTSSIVKQLSMDTQKIQAWIIKNGESKVSSHYLRSIRLSINASPTLLINNKPVEFTISEKRLLKESCDSKHIQSKSCDSVPECFDDSDCKKPGKIGLCIKQSGTCNYQDAVSFSLVILKADSTILHPENSVIQTTKDLFAGAQIKEYTLSSKEGKKLFEQYKPKTLPFFHFSKEVEQAYNFSSVQEGLETLVTGFTFKDGVIQPNFFPSRKKVNSQLKIFMDPLAQEMPFWLNTILKKDSMPEIEPILLAPMSNVEKISIEEQVRQEEAVRWVVLKKQYPKLFYKYLTELRTNPLGLTYWFIFLQKNKIDIPKFIELVNQHKSSLENIYKTQTELYIQSPFVVLKNNQELIPIRNEQDLQAVFP